MIPHTLINKKTYFLVENNIKFNIYFRLILYSIRREQYNVESLRVHFDKEEP
jgi:hypothetical protein